jgi:hypothetical protein
MFQFLLNQNQANLIHWTSYIKCVCVKSSKSNWPDDGSIGISGVLGGG